MTLQNLNPIIEESRNQLSVHRCHCSPPREASVVPRSHFHSSRTKAGEGDGRQEVKVGQGLGIRAS